MSDYKSRFFADFVPKGYRIINKNEVIKKDDWFWTNGHYRPVHNFLIGTRTKLPVVRKIHEPTETSNTLIGSR